MNRSYRYLSYILFLPLALGVVSPCFALDLEAGLWNHIPLGSNFAGAAYAHTEGNLAVADFSGFGIPVDRQPRN